MKRPVTDFSNAIKALVEAALPQGTQVELFDGEVSIEVLRLKVAAPYAVFIGYRGSDTAKTGRRCVEELHYTVTLCLKPAAYQPGMYAAAATTFDLLVGAIEGSILFADGFAIECPRKFARTEYTPPLYGVDCAVKQAYAVTN